MRATKPVHFKVRGKGQFPVDMLRYDECYPVDPVSVENIQEQKREGKTESSGGRPVLRDVHLVSYKAYGPTEARWESFNWMVYWDTE